MKGSNDGQLDGFGFDTSKTPVVETILLNQTTQAKKPTIRFRGKGAAGFCGHSMETSTISSDTSVSMQVGGSGDEESDEISVYCKNPLGVSFTEEIKGGGWFRCNNIKKGGNAEETGKFQVGFRILSVDGTSTKDKVSTGYLFFKKKIAHCHSVIRTEFSRTLVTTVLLLPISCSRTKSILFYLDMCNADDAADEAGH